MDYLFLFCFYFYRKLFLSCSIFTDEIPEVARIIAVADAYDTMTSKRSYRDVLPQAIVRNEIAMGKGTQFDPVIADIMLEMIDEDTEYSMQEKII